LGIPFRSAQIAGSGSEAKVPDKIFASKHLTNELTWFILQGCQRNGGKHKKLPRISGEQAD
jgi:hypothetical protein